MARSVKHTDLDKIQILDEYIVTVKHGDVKTLKYTNIAEYAQSVGYNLQEYDFRRSDAVKEHIQKLQEGKITIGTIPIIKPYEPLDLNRFLKESQCNVITLSNKIQELDSLCGQYAQEINRIQGRCVTFQHEAERERQASALFQTQIAELKIQLDQAKKQTTLPVRDDDELQFLREQNRQFRLFLQRYFVRDVAAFLVSEKQPNWQCDLLVVNMEKLQEMLETYHLGDLPDNGSPDDTTIPKDEVNTNVPASGTDGDQCFFDEINALDNLLLNGVKEVNS